MHGFFDDWYKLRGHIIDGHKFIYFLLIFLHAGEIISTGAFRVTGRYFRSEVGKASYTSISSAENIVAKEFVESGINKEL